MRPHHVFNADDFAKARRDREVSEWLARQKSKSAPEREAEFQDYLADRDPIQPRTFRDDRAPGLAQDEDLPGYDRRLFGRLEEERFDDILTTDGFRWPRPA